MLEKVPKERRRMERRVAGEMLEWVALGAAAEVMK
jgi:hypothetical protein